MEIEQYHKYIRQYFGEWYNDELVEDKDYKDDFLEYAVELSGKKYKVASGSLPGSMRSIYVQDFKGGHQIMAVGKFNQFVYMVTFESEEHSEIDDIYLMGRDGFVDIEKGSEMEFLGNLFENGAWSLREK